MAGRSRLDLVRRIVGTTILGLIVASILGVAPAPLVSILGRPLIASAQTVAADNVSAVTTSRDGAPFNGNIWFNNTVLVNITFNDFVNTTTFPTVKIGLRVLSPDRTVIRFTCEVTARPAVDGALVSVYSTTVFINNTHLAFHNATPPGPTSLTDFRNATCSPAFVAPALNMSSGDIIQIFNTSFAGTPVVFKELIFKHTAASGVEGIPSTVSSRASVDDVPLTGIFNVTAPDLNVWWNLRDNTTIYIVFGNDSLGYYLTNNFTLIETGRNTGKFWNTGVNTLGMLVNSTGVNATGRFFATGKILKEGSYNISILVPKANSTPAFDLAGALFGAGTGIDAQQITDFGASAIKNYFDVVNVTITVAPPAPVSVFVDRDFIPATTDYNISINVTIVDPYITDASNQVVFGKTLNITIYNAVGNAFKSNLQLNATTPHVIPRLPTVSVVILINGSAAFQPPYQVQNGFLRVEYLSPSGVKERRDIPIRVVDVSISVNETASVNVVYGNAISITVVNPAANNDTSKFDTLVVKVSGAAFPTTVTLNETAPNSGVFTALLTVANDGNIYADPGKVITFSYVHNNSVETPLGASSWVSRTVTASVRVLATAGSIESPADGTRTGPHGSLNVVIRDPDMNRNINSQDTITYSIRLWNGTVITRTATETDKNTGVFRDTPSKSLFAPTVRELLLGGRIEIIYTDPSTPAGPIIVTSTVFFVSFDGVVRLDKPFYMPGDVITINVTDPDAIGTVTVRVTSTSDPIGVSVTLNELFLVPGTFIGYITVSNRPEDFGRSGYIFARFGDVITVTYTDSYPADYAATGRAKDIVARATVGQVLEKPVSFPPTATMTYADGTPVTQPVAGRLVLFSLNATNNNPVATTATFLFQVLDARGVPLTIQALVITIPAGQTIGMTFSFAFPAPGSYTVRITAVKSLTDLTPLADKLEFTVTVVGGTVAPGIAASAISQQSYRAAVRI
ncbi:MAG: hypothetical protein QXI22_06630 [Sulfolobales archaeon]